MKYKEYAGYWWLPDNPGKKITGVLSIHQRKSIALKSVGCLLSKQVLYGKQLNLLSQDSVLGEVADGNLVTLLNVNAGLHSGDNPTNACDFLTSSYEANVAIVGKRHFQSKDEVVLSSVKVRLNLLSEWLCKSGLVCVKDDDGNYTEPPVIKYEYPEILDFRIDAIQSKIRTSYEHELLSLSGCQWQLSHKSFLILTPDTPQALDWYLCKLESIRNFLIVMTGFPLDVEEIVGYSNKIAVRNDSERTTQEIFQIFLKRSKTFKNTVSKHPAKLLTTLSEIEDEFGAVLNAWFEKANVLESAVLLCTANLSIDLGYSEFSLLNYAQALETLHRRQFGGKHRQNARIRELLNDVWDNCLENFVEDKSAFVRKVDGTRNYVVHFDPDERAEVVYGTDIFYLAERLRILLITHILIQLKVPRDKVYGIISRFVPFEHLKNKTE